MQRAIEAFRVNAARVRNLGGLYSSMESLTTSAIDLSDLLRTQIVLMVSALDYFVHEITVQGMLQIFDGTRKPTDAFKKQRVSGSLLLIPKESSRSAFEADVRDRHSFLSFQQPEKIADAIRMFHPSPLWRAVAGRLNQSEGHLKTRLQLIVDRRNKIAHEADINPSFPGERWPITSSDTETALNYLETLCEAIYEEVTCLI